jgi:hypothetical protein
MRSSSEEAVSQLNKWRSESAKVFVEIPGIDSNDFSLSVSLKGAEFEYRDRREPLHFWKPQRGESEFESVLQIRLQDGKRLVFAELRDRDI